MEFVAGEVASIVSSPITCISLTLSDCTSIDEYLNVICITRTFEYTFSLLRNLVTCVKMTSRSDLTLFCLRDF